MTTPYIPQPGTTPARALAYFQAQPAGHSITGAVLAEILDVERGSIQASTRHALLAGALKCEKREGLLWYSLGDGTPLQRDEDSEPTAALRKHSRQLAMGITATPPSPAKLRRKSNSSALVQVVGEPAPVPSTRTHQPLRLAVWSDGALAIERGADRINFSLDETRQIIHYLERMASPEPTAAGSATA